jgi:hypothetical protein
MNEKCKRTAPVDLSRWVRLLVIFAFLLGMSAVAAAQSSDRDHPTPLASDEIKGAGTGKKVEYYYSFTGGPGQVLLTIDLKAKTAATNAEIEVFDPSGSKLFYYYPNATTKNERALKRFAAPEKQTLTLRLALDSNAGDYAIKLSDAVELPATKPPAILPDLSIESFELVDPEKGQVNIVVVNKGSSGYANAAACTLRLIVWAPGQFEKKEARTVFVKVPPLHTGGKATVVAIAGIPIINTRYSMFVDIGHDVTELNENNNRAEGEAGNYKP